MQNDKCRMQNDCIPSEYFNIIAEGDSIIQHSAFIIQHLSTAPVECGNTNCVEIMGRFSLHKPVEKLCISHIPIVEKKPLGL